MVRPTASRQAKRARVGSDSSCCIRTPFGALKLLFCAGELDSIEFMPPGSRPRPPVGTAQKAAVSQIRGYLRDPLAQLSFRFPAGGTPFQRRVWGEIMRIPPSATRTYGDIARRLKTSPRAVGGALGANPLPVMIPCHRVVARTGLGGFMGAEQGWGMDVKKWLLDHEKACLPH